ncbi:MAG: hypothetical protein IPJ06_15085 [Saprospiraceae bacterium]|nr:hypothetical protein [Saprospiraceae bacterium]
MNPITWASRVVEIDQSIAIIIFAIITDFLCGDSQSADTQKEAYDVLAHFNLRC